MERLVSLAPQGLLDWMRRRMQHIEQHFAAPDSPALRVRGRPNRVRQVPERAPATDSAIAHEL